MKNKTRPIDANELIKELRNKKGAFATGEGNEPFMEWEVEDYINDQTIIDAVEVVRCKDCKHHRDEHLYGIRLRFDWCRKFNNVTKDDDFCSYGERKADVI